MLPRVQTNMCLSIEHTYTYVCAYVHSYAHTFNAEVVTILMLPLKLLMCIHIPQGPNTGKHMNLRSHIHTFIQVCG